ncbi:MAG TPA: MBL fold metallo-hydrolase [Steroidobacteraceae bacterium]|nr:MBL fold metallo-hydrolase [Steroidobacteraceae bacterium]
MSEAKGSITREGEVYPSPRRAVEYLPVDPPPPGHARPVADRVWWGRIPLPMELNHINVWLMDDGEGWTVVDTGLCAEACQTAWATLEAQPLAAKPLRRIFVTHDHADHTGLARWLAERHGAEVWMNGLTHQGIRDWLGEATAARHERVARFMRAHGLSAAELKPISPAGEDTTGWFGGVPPLARACADGEEMHGAGRRWRMIEVDGHCRGHLCLWDRDGEVLISGDQVLPTISPNVSVLSIRPDDDPLRAFLASLDRLEHCAEGTLVLPSHGRPFRGLHRRLDVVRAHHRQQLDLLRAACRERPHTAYELLPTMFGRALRGFHRYLALGETVAHLNYLWHGGELMRTADPQGVLRFQAA